MPTASTQNFKDKNDELSVCIAGETLPEAALAGHEGFGLVQFTAGLVRKVIADFKAAAFLCRDPLPEMPGHALICGRVTDGMARQIRAAAVWVDGCWPRRPAG